MSPEKAHTTLEMDDNVIYLNFEYVNLVSSMPFCVTNLVNQREKSRVYSTESADSTSKTDDRLDRWTRLSPTLSTQLDSDVKRSTRSISGSMRSKSVSICNRSRARLVHSGRNRAF